ncbi:hypothetical protein [Paenibacillus montanisoli]|uniref:Polymer-forming cytoskeletal protein n=1 Tax=Paenibacillus montanisoli TaxID=2081970 RepID=A0A328TXK0_9BACL|nr:hypothetical protein [Paenibacillus montanisoli]RAP73831.1 hypothetical protein DL346_26640 [Paenibacillus montanisoli]
MSTMNRPDFAISGVGSTAGGQFHRVELEGVSRVSGDLDCYSFSMNGMATVKGGVRSEERFKASGKLTVEGSVHAAVMELEGQMKVRGGVSCDVYRMNGFAKVYGDCSAQQCDVRGGMTVGGVLHADRLEIYLDGPVRAEVIRCRELRMKQGGGGSLKRFLQSILPTSWQAQLRADRIEGDDLELKETTAALVRGRRVTIGAGSVIDRVEYESELIVHPDAIVRNRAKIRG